MKFITLAVFFICICSAFATAGPFAWISDNTGTIGTVDISNGVVNVIGSAGVVLFDIAFDPGRNLWGVTPTNLYRINQSTGLATLVGGLGVTNVSGLVFGSDGILYGSSNTLFTINTSTGQATAVGPIGFQSQGDLAFVNGTLYMSNTAAELVSVNTITGQGTSVGPMGVTLIAGLGNPGSQMLYGGSGTNIYTINTSTGAATLLGDYGGQGLGGVFGMAFEREAAVPEPKTFTMLACGLLLTARSYLSKRRLSRSSSPKLKPTA